MSYLSILTTVLSSFLSQVDHQELLSDQAEQIEDLKMWIVAFLIVAFVIIVIMSFIIQSNRILKKQNTTIKSQQEEISKINRNLAIQVENLREMNAEKNSVIHYVSHDLITPLANIEGLVNLILLNKDALKNDQHEYLVKIREVVKGGKDLIHSMLNIDKIEQEIKGIDLMEYDAIELVREALLGSQFQAESKRVVVQEKHDKDSVQIKTDKQYFKQILANLISTAIKNSPEDKPVMIATHDHGQTIQIEIKDEGLGLSEKDINRLFLKYSAGRGTAEGSGLSLAIVKQLVEKLSAKIRVESQPDQGTLFILEFLKG